MALDFVNTKMVTDSDGVLYEAAMLQNGNVGFGVRKKDDYWLASVLDREQVVHPDDVKLHNQEAAQQRAEELYLEQSAAWCVLDWVGLGQGKNDSPPTTDPSGNPL